MNGGEFDSLMNIVYSRWNAKAYPEAVRNRIWFFVKDIPAKSFERIIYILLDTQRAAPMPQEFKMLAYAEKDALGIRTAREPETKSSREAKCWDCGDSGNLFVESPNGKKNAVMRCHCEVGRARPNAHGAIWTNSFANTWVKIPKYEKIKGDFRPKPDQKLIDMVAYFRVLLRENAKNQAKERHGNLQSAGEILKLPPPEENP